MFFSALLFIFLYLLFSDPAASSPQEIGCSMLFALWSFIPGFPMSYELSAMSFLNHNSTNSTPSRVPQAQFWGWNWGSKRKNEPFVWMKVSDHNNLQRSDPRIAVPPAPKFERWTKSVPPSSKKAPPWGPTAPSSVAAPLAVAPLLELVPLWQRMFLIMP